MNDIHSYSYGRFSGQTINVKRLDPKAIIPTKANDTDAGWDLYALKQRFLGPNQRTMFLSLIHISEPTRPY